MNYKESLLSLDKDNNNAPFRKKNESDRKFLKNQQEKIKLLGKVPSDDETGKSTNLKILKEF